MERPVESLQDFKARIAAIVGDKTEHIAGAFERANVVPNPQPGAPIPGGLRIVSAHATPLFDDFGIWKKGAVNVHFNGAATKTCYVDVGAKTPGSPFYTDVGMARLDPGQTDVQVPIKVDIREPAQIPLKVTTRGATGEFLTMTHYRGQP